MQGSGEPGSSDTSSILRKRVGEPALQNPTTFDDSPPSAPSMGQALSSGGNGAYVHLNQQTYFTGDTVSGM